MTPRLFLPADSCARRMRILVCGPPANDTAALARRLERLGCEAIAMPAVADALRAVNGRPVDLLIAMLRPAANEDESLSMLQLFRRAVPATPVVIVSPDGSLAMRARCQAVRPWFFVVPPLADPELHAIVAGALEQRRLERA